jgi:uncharacterized delta-60 repeat protein
MFAGLSSPRSSLLTLFVTLFVAVQAFSQAGQLDPSFGKGGIVTLDFGNQINIDIASANAIAVQSDGKIVVCGGIPSSSGFPVAALARFDSNGTLDKSFGNAGVVSTPQLGSNLNAINIQEDGKIVAAGPAGGAIILVARYDSNGSLDTSFGD